MGSALTFLSAYMSSFHVEGLELEESFYIDIVLSVIIYGWLAVFH